MQKKREKRYCFNAFTHFLNVFLLSIRSRHFAFRLTFAANGSVHKLSNFEYYKTELRSFWKILKI